MKSLELPFATRVRLTGILATAVGLPLAVMNSLGDIYDLVRFSEDELKQIKIEDQGNGKSLFSTLDTFPPKKIEIEDIAAKHLDGYLENNNVFSIADREWVNALRKALK